MQKIKEFIQDIEDIFFDDWQHIHKNLKKDFYKITTIQLIASLIEIASLVFLTIYLAFILDSDAAVQSIKKAEELLHVKLDVNILTFLIIGFYIVKTAMVLLAIKEEIKYVAKYSAIVGRKLIEVITSNEIYTTGKIDITEKQRIVDLDAIRMILYIRNYSIFIKEVFSIIIMISVAAIYDIKILAVIMTLIAILFLIYKTIIETTLTKDGVASKIIRIKELQLMFKILELNNLLKIYGLKNKEYSAYESTVEKRENIEGRRRLIAAMPKLLIEILTVAIIAIAVLITNIYDPNSTKQILIAIIGLSIISVRLIPTINSLAYAASELAYQSNSYLRVKNIIKTEYTKSDISQSNVQNKMSIQYNEPSDLIIRDVWYKYPGSATYVFQGLNFTIRKGTFVGIFGRSGIGKTTLIDLISGVIKPQKGTVMHGNISIHDNYDLWCNSIALVPQNSKFFPGSIYENIVFDDDEVDYDRLYKACELARITDVAKNLELIAAEEIPTSISQTLSGGQKQRLSIARALYRKASILILDEATSALDQKTKEEIILDLLKLKGTLTIIMVTHDTSLKEYFDQIIELGK